MRVAAGTATAMVKTLADAGLVEYEPRGGVKLSAKGEKLALHVLRRHRLVELFLVEVLGLDWSEVDQEAEELEHAISDKVLEKIDALLKHPQVDPHGDPIPTAKGKIAHRAMVSLAECELNRPMRVRTGDRSECGVLAVCRSAQSQAGDGDRCPQAGWHFRFSRHSAEESIRR